MRTGDAVSHRGRVVTAVEHRAQGNWHRLGEAMAVVASPALLYFVVRPRLMSPVLGPDPSLHTTFIVDPRDAFIRYSSIYPSTARFREGARVGFLVPARLAYLAFGAVPGFIVTRYALALVAIVPVYVLLRRVFGRAGGAIGIATILGSPVVVTALGTDYPDSAAVAYLAGALACLAMPPSGRFPRAWLISGGALATLAVWSHGTAIPLVVVLFLVYTGIRRFRAKSGLWTDLAILALTASAVTVALMVASALEFGRADFISVTYRSFTFLNQPSQVAMWHSTNWHWAPYVAYLLVPPAVIVAYVVTFGSRVRAIPTPQLFVGLVAAGQLIVFASLQFVGHVQTLQQPFFSSLLWSGVCVALSFVLAEIVRPLYERRFVFVVPAVILLAVTLGYEATRPLPVMGWIRGGAIIAALLVAFVGAARLLPRIHHPLSRYVATGACLAGTAGCVLLLTVAVPPPHPSVPDTALVPPPLATYSTALGTNGSAFVDAYRVTTELPRFVGNASYPGEQLLMWWPQAQTPWLLDAAGMYHAGFNRLPSDPPDLTPDDVTMLDQRRAPELLLLSTTGDEFPATLQALAPFGPTVVRTATLRAGVVVVHAELISLARFAPHRA